MRAWLRWFTVALGLIGGSAVTDLASAGSSNVDDATALSTSVAYLQARAADWGIRKAQDEFRVRQVVRDSLGQTHVRLDQISQGLPVFGHQLIVHLDQSGAPQSVTGTYRAGIAGSARPAVSGQRAVAIARAQFPGSLSEPPEVELLWYPTGASVRLAHRVVLNDDDTPRRVVVFVDALTRTLIHSHNDLRTLAPSPAWPSASGGAAGAAVESAPDEPAAATGVGHSLYLGTISITTNQGSGTFTMADATRGNLSTSNMKNRGFGKGKVFSDVDNTWGDGTTGDPASAAVDAHFGAEMTWDYYLTVHGRDGIFDDGVGALSRVHYKRSYNNAFWNDSCKCMTYGDGDGSTFSALTAVDVAGHEMTHGVTSATAALIYDNQSGGLNEAMSDIFGTMVEFFAVAHGAAKTPNYLIGEDIFTPGIPGDALRYMNNPTLDGHSIDTFASYNDNVDVHYSSGIANNAFFLLAEGGTHRLGGVVTGIGRSAAERIFYRALTVYMTPSETFSQARAHTRQAAIDLFGPTSQQVLSVGQAWSAVGVN